MELHRRIVRWKRRAIATFPLVTVGLCTCSGVAIFFVPQDSGFHPVFLLVFCVTAFAAFYWSKDNRR